jgi:hypothetical protein
MDNYNYPVGADTKDAPWNQVELSKKEFEVVTSQTLRKSTTVHTSDYTLEEDWDDDLGKVAVVNVQDTDWSQAYQEEHASVVDLLWECKRIAQELYDIHKDFANTPTNRKEMQELKYIMSECDGWITDDFEVTQDS